MSKAVMVSEIDICFSTDSFEYRSSRCIQMSSETAFAVGITCPAIRSCFRFVDGRCSRLTFFVRDLAAITGTVCRRGQTECLEKKGRRGEGYAQQHVQVLETMLGAVTRSVNHCTTAERTRISTERERGVRDGPEEMDVSW